MARKPRCTCPRNHFVPNINCPVHGEAAKRWRDLHKPTIAEQIAQELGNDGTRWRTADDVTFDELMQRHHGRCQQQNNTDRYVFSDGSAIVAGGACWDLEGKEPFSWRGLE